MTGIDGKLIWRISSALSCWIKRKEFPRYFTLVSKKRIKDGYELVFDLFEWISHSKHFVGRFLFRISSGQEDIINLGKRLALYRFEIKGIGTDYGNCSGRVFPVKNLTNSGVDFLCLKQLYGNLAKLFKSG